MTARWDLPTDLEVLLVALEAEIIACTDAELHVTLAESGRAPETVLHEMRTVLDAAMRDDDIGTLPQLTEPMVVCHRVWRH